MIRDHLRSNIVGYAALFVALTAGAYAAGLPRNSVKSKQIKDGQVKLADLSAGSVDGTKVADGSLSGVDFGGTLPAGPAGVQGPTGPKGEQGTAGSPDTGAQILGKLAAVDGAGSGLDADAIDGLSSGAFIASGSAAGGDLTGSTYPNPQIAPGAVGPVEQGVVPAARALTPNNATCTGNAQPVSGTDTIIRFVGEQFDDGAVHDQTCGQSSRLAAPRGGVYTVSAGVVWSNTSQVGKRTLAIQQDGATLLAQDEYSAASALGTLQNVSTIVRLAQGSYVEALVNQTSGAPLTVAGLADDRNYLAMAWLGP